MRNMGLGGRMEWGWRFWGWFEKCEVRNAKYEIRNGKFVNLLIRRRFAKFNILSQYQQHQPVLPYFSSGTKGRRNQDGWEVQFERLCDLGSLGAG